MNLFIKNKLFKVAMFFLTLFVLVSCGNSCEVELQKELGIAKIEIDSLRNELADSKKLHALFKRQTEATMERYNKLKLSIEGPK